jgi:chromosome segregation ATPase
MSKSENHPNLLKRCLSVAMCLGILVVLGCSSGVKRSDKAVSSAKTLKRECTNLQGQIDKTIQSLDGVVAAKEAGLRVAYNTYVSELKTLKSQSKKVASRAQKLKKSSQAYLDAWEKKMQEVSNPELREQAAQRRATASARFEDSRDEFDRIRTDYEQFAKNLRDIKVVLDNDLNPAGVSSIEDVIAQAKVDSKPLKKDIATIIEALDGITEALAGPPPVEPSADK